MALPTITVKPGFVQENTQHLVTYTGEMTISNDTYPANGIAIMAFLIAALMPTTNNVPHTAEFWSTTGTGYIYDFIKATQLLQVLEVPPSGSLVTAAPLQQLGSGATLSEVSADIIQFRISFRRNSS